MTTAYTSRPLTLRERIEAAQTRREPVREPQPAWLRRQREGLNAAKELTR